MSVQVAVALKTVSSVPTLTVFRIHSSATQTMTAEIKAMKRCVPTVRT